MTRALSAVSVTDSGSMSQASTGPQPSLAAAIARMPLPQPQSAIGPSGVSSTRSSKDSRVVACEPVPNPCPGSMTTSSAPSRGSCHGGRTRSGPTSIGTWNECQSISGTSLVDTSTSAAPATAVTSPISGSSPGAP